MTASTTGMGNRVTETAVSMADGTRTVSRETFAEGEPAARTVSRETVFDTPIAREAMQAVRVQNVRREEWPAPSATRVITVANQKGGVGKTTSAVNLAVALALHGLRVVVIDLDPQGNASTALGVPHQAGTPSSYDVLLGEQTLSEVAVEVEDAPGLLCVPATIDLAGADIELASQVAREHRLRRAVEQFLAQGDQVDYVFIDCPPALGLLTLNALVAGREILIPIQCEYYALEGLAQLLNTVGLVKTQLNESLDVSTVLLTMYDSRTRLADQVADEVRNYFGNKVIRSVIPRNVRVSEAPGYGQTVMTYDPGSRGAIGYLEAAHELAVRGAAVVAMDATGDIAVDGDSTRDQADDDIGIGQSEPGQPEPGESGNYAEQPGNYAGQSEPGQPGNYTEQPGNYTEQERQ
jgi:chromosome partitioning protein